MPRRARSTPKQRLILGAFFLVAALALFLPRSWFRPLGQLAQVLLPFQVTASLAGDRVADAFEADPQPVSGDQYEAMRVRKEALEHQVAALSVRVDELERENALLTAIRQQSIGASGRLVPARVISDDVVAWRSSRLIDAGALAGVRPGAAVVTDAFAIDRGEEEGVLSGMAILLAESLVGTVEESFTHSARVKLLSDKTTRMRVRIGRFADGQFVALNEGYWLTGLGKGRMQIREVDRRAVEGGDIAAGDVVLADPSSGVAPAAITIGRIVAIEPDHQNPLLSILEVESPIEEGALRRVYVFDPGEQTGE